MTKFVPVSKLFNQMYGRDVSNSTSCRWRSTGMDGKILRFARIGGVCCTTEEWLREFIEGDVIRKDTTFSIPKTRSAKTRERAANEANKYLDAAGIKV